jgi:hypothetical protein
MVCVIGKNEFYVEVMIGEGLAELVTRCSQSAAIVGR